MVNGIRAFLPGSLVDIRPVKDTTPFEGKALDFKVIKLDRKRNNVVVSRRAVLEASLGAEREELLKTLQEGAIVKGVVKILRTTAHSSTWVASTVYCISPTSRGAGSSILRKCWRWATRLRPKYSSSIRKRIASRSA